MDAKLKRKWVRALRGGQYVQGTGLLVSNEGTQFCCIGVLADVQGCVWQESDGENLVPILPRSRKPLCADGTDHLNPRRAGLSRPRQARLIEMNDAGKSFAEIADYIEQNL